MTDKQFMAHLQEILQCEQSIDMDTALQELEEWDSVAFMVVITFFDKYFGKKITFADLKVCYSPADLLAIAAKEKN